MLHARREICEIVRCIPERFLGNCQSWSLTRACVLGMWRLCKPVIKMASRRRPKRPNQIVVRTIDGSQPAARDGEGWPQLPPAGVLFAVLSEMRERWCGHI
jgi:hypothetical protein